jgi:hypothetical protein
MARDEVDPSLILAQPRKRKLTSYITNEDNASADKDETIKRIKKTINPSATESQSSNENDGAGTHPGCDVPLISTPHIRDSDPELSGKQSDDVEVNHSRKQRPKKTVPQRNHQSSDEDDSDVHIIDPHTHRLKTRNNDDDDLVEVEAPKKESAEHELGKSSSRL